MNSDYHLHDDTAQRIVDEFRTSSNPTKVAVAGTILAQNPRLDDPKDDE